MRDVKNRKRCGSDRVAEAYALVLLQFSCHLISFHQGTLPSAIAAYTHQSSAAAYNTFGLTVFYDSVPGIVDNIRIASTDGLIYCGLGKLVCKILVTACLSMSSLVSSLFSLLQSNARPV